MSGKSPSWWRCLSACVAICLTVSACARRPAGDHAEDEHGATAEHGEPNATEHAALEHPAAAEEVRLPLADLRGLAFTRVGEPQEEGFWAPAEAVSDTASVAMVTAPAAGMVRRLLVRSGADVRSGEAVAELASAEIADLVARYRTARVEEQRAGVDAERERALLVASATSPREVEAAEAAVARATAEAEAARQSLAARGVVPEGFAGTLRLTAPAAGTLERWDVALGQGVEAGTALATIRDRAATRVRVELAPPEPADWVAGARAEVRRGDGTRWQALVEGLPAGLTAETRRYPYLLRLDAGPFPSPGTPLEVRVPFARGLVLPQEALQIVEGDWGVFVKEGEEVVFRRVRRGAELGGDVLVLAGIEPGMEVATAGAYLLRPLWMKRRGGGEAHAH
jgi:cobalt-zinc-cadmium efflux system membrane fusion protein